MPAAIDDDQLFIRKWWQIVYSMSSSIVVDTYQFRAQDIYLFTTSRREYDGKIIFRLVLIRYTSRMNIESIDSISIFVFIQFLFASYSSYSS